MNHKTKKLSPSEIAAARGKMLESAAQAFNKGLRAMEKPRGAVARRQVNRRSTYMKANAPLALAASRVKKSLRFSQKGDHMVATGSDYIGSVTVSGSSTHTVGETLWSSYLGLDVLNSSRLGEFAKLYEKYKIKSFTLMASGAQPSTAAHQLLLTYDYDPSDDTAVGDAGLHAAMGMTNSGYFKSWENAQLVIPPHRLDKWLYTSKGVELQAGTATDQRLYDCGFLELKNVLPFTASAGGDSLVSLWCVFEVEFDIPQLQKTTPASYFADWSSTFDIGSVLLQTGNHILEKCHSLSPVLQAFSSAVETATELVSFLGSFVTAGNLTHTGKFFRLPAGLYEMHATVSATDLTTGNLVSALASTSAGAHDQFRITPVAASFVGTRNPLTTYFGGRLWVPPAAVAENCLTFSTLFKLSEEAIVDFVSVSSGGYNIQCVRANTKLDWRFTIERVRSMFRAPGTLVTTNVCDNGPSGMITATDGVFYADFESEMYIPDGWWIVGSAGKSTMWSRIAVSPPDADGVDGNEVESIASSADTVAKQLAQSATLQAMPLCDRQRVLQKLRA